MANSPTYASIAADIMKMASAADDPRTTQRALEMSRVFAEFLQHWTAKTDGYMVFCAFVVSFTELKKTIEEAPEDNRAFMRELLLGVIGSFGKVVQ